MPTALVSLYVLRVYPLLDDHWPHYEFFCDSVATARLRATVHANGRAWNLPWRVEVGSLPDYTTWEAETNTYRYEINEEPFLNQEQVAKDLEWRLSRQKEHDDAAGTV